MNTVQPYPPGFIEAQGVGATVTFDGLAVTITRKGVAGAMTGGRGETRMTVDQIMAVHLKPATVFVAGFIQFLTSARQSPSSNDQNSIMFNKPHTAAFEALRDAVQAALPEREPGPDVIEAKGINGATVTFDGTTVAIARAGFNAVVVGPGAGEKRIPVKAISAIQLGSGFIQFSFSGESAASRRQSVSDRMKDENSVQFGVKQRPAFEALRDAIEAAQAQAHTPAPAAAAGPTVAERIQQLAGLRDQGLITEAEFEAKRVDLLAQL